MEFGQQNVFYPEQKFFIIDSEKLDNITSKWYGFAVVNNKLVQSEADLQGAMPAGEKEPTSISNEREIKSVFFRISLEVMGFIFIEIKTFLH